jgi:DNA-binding transcriptional MocR family regulator
MTLGRREQLVRLARQCDALIVTDDVYDHLQWSSTHQTRLARPDMAALPRVVDIDRFIDGGPKDGFGNVVSNGSFSKIVGPGCRVGWAEGTERLICGISQA